MSEISTEQQEREALVAEWLKATPGFFERHADLLASIQLKSTHDSRAISLQEKQLKVLRDQNEALNRRLSEMLHFGNQNDRTQGLMVEWLKSLLQAHNQTEIEHAVIEGLKEIFGIEQILLTHQADAKDYCGTINHAPDSVKALLVAGIKSLAIVALPTQAKELVLASHAEAKFTADMGRHYLNQIASLVDAALSRVSE